MITWNNFLFSFPARETIIRITLLHDFLFVILLCILLVVFLNFYYSFNSTCFNLKFSENHFLEFVWTCIPFFILSFVIYSSVKSLYFSDSCFFCGISLIVVGHQWYWSYFYKDLRETFFDSYIISNFLRVLDVDNRVIIPFNLPVRVIVSSADVIHSWTIPSLGLKIDCIPGRLNQTCFSFNRCGIFFGQCSEICGINHRFMPITAEVVRFENFFNCFLLFILSKGFYLLSKQWGFPFSKTLVKFIISICQIEV